MVLNGSRVEDEDDASTTAATTTSSTMKVLVATDSHLGYLERDPVRGLDSFAAFEETLLLAKEKKVDLVLLGGDLFHDNKPSRRTLHKTMGILRRCCMGEEPVNFEIVSDGRDHFPTDFPTANIDDPNYSVALPIFSIHGNHDDPVKDASLSSELEPSLAALDLLHSANLLNYFGKSPEVDNVPIEPILLEKGETRLALYGLGNQRDERLARLWNAGKVFFSQATHELFGDDEGEATGSDEEEEKGGKKVFHLFVLHQNRQMRGKNFIREELIPEFMDLVIWGHEHEAKDLEESLVGTFRILQPGSTVATSLVPGEAARKHVALLTIECDGRFLVERIPLTQVRPFRYDHVVLSDYPELNPDDPKIDKEITKALSGVVKDLIEREDDESHDRAPPAGQSITLRHKDQPLIRLSIDYTGFKTINNSRFGSAFVGKVANPSDILIFKKQPRAKAAPTKKGGKGDNPVAPDRDVDIQDLVKDTLLVAQNKLELIPEAGLNEALIKFVNLEETSAIAAEVERVLISRQSALKSSLGGKADPKDMEATLKTMTEKEMKDKELDHLRRSTADAMLNASSVKRNDDGGGERRGTGGKRAARGEGRGRGRTTTKARGRKQMSDSETESSDGGMMFDSGDDHDAAPRKRSGRGRLSDATSSPQRSRKAPPRRAAALAASKVPIDVYMVPDDSDIDDNAREAGLDGGGSDSDEASPSEMHKETPLRGTKKRAAPAKRGSMDYCEADIATTAKKKTRTIPDSLMKSTTASKKRGGASSSRGSSQKQQHDSFFEEWGDIN